MALTETQVVAAIRELVGFADPAPFNFSKADVRAAIVAADNWLGTNAVLYNTALPQPFRGQATVEMKAALLAFVALRRAGR